MVSTSMKLRMVAYVTETRSVIPSLEFKTCMTTKSQVFTDLSRFDFNLLTAFNWLLE